jgi:transposase
VRRPSCHRLEIGLTPLPVRGLPPLSADERTALEHDYRYGSSRQLRQSCHIVLSAYECPSQQAVARVVRCSRATVNRTLQRYRSGGRLALPRRPASKPARARITPAWRALLAQAMVSGPRACGVPRPTWTAPLLADSLAKQTGIQVSERTVRRELAALDYVCRRGTWTVRHKAEEQPDYSPKRKGSKRS